MQTSEAVLFVEAIKGLIRQQINEARHGHEKWSADNHDYEQDIVDLLTAGVNDED